MCQQGPWLFATRVEKLKDASGWVYPKDGPDSVNGMQRREFVLEQCRTCGAYRERPLAQLVWAAEEN